MIPLKLTIEGLYSYKSRQTIDFRKLTASGLFAIFGEVGSGKSSILEAMMMALFEKTKERIGEKENRYYNMMNLQSNRMHICLECLAGKEGKETFRFEFRAERNKKDFEKIDTPKRGIYVFQNQEFIPETRTTEEILGMSYENFRQTIIIPQGKFRDFIELGGTKRTGMLQELFRLDRFDLSDKVNEMNRNTKSVLDHLEGQLSTLREATPERCAALTEAIAQAEQQETKANAYKKQIQTDLRQAETLAKMFTELNTANKNLDSLNTAQEIFDKKKETIKKYKTVQTVFSADFQVFTELKKDIELLQTQNKKAETELNTIEENLTKATQEFEGIAASYRQKDKYKRICEELQTIITLKKEEEKLTGLQKAINNLTDEAEKIKKEATELKEIVTQNERQYDQLKAALPDITLLSEVKNWFILNTQFQKNEKDKKNKLDLINQQLSDIEHNITKLLTQIGFELTSQPQNDLPKILQEKIKDQKHQITVLEEEKAQLAVKKRLADIAEHLHEGEPCPVCGAKEHPNLLTRQNIDELLLQNKIAKDTVEKSVELLQQQERALADFLKEKSLKKDAQKEIEDEYQAELRHLTKHQAAFVWHDFDKNDANSIQIAYQNYQDTEKKLTLITADTKSKREKVIAIENAQQQNAEQLSAKKLQITAIQTYIDTTKGSIKELANTLTNYLDKTIDNLQEIYQQSVKKLQKIENDYQILEKQIKELQSKKDTQTGILQTNQQSLFAKTQKYNTLYAKIAENLKNHNITSLEELEKILTNHLDIEAEEQKINQHEQSKAFWKATIHELKEKLGTATENPAQVQQLQQQYEAVEKQVNDILKEKAEKTAERNRIMEDLRQRTDLEAEKEVVEKKAEQLKILADLFKGKGFVEYVAQKYLDHLVANANKRFQKLSHNTLGLELNENQDFMVKDYLNDGKTRLLKTLSGGQIFQAALCLSLALAENVKAINQSEKSFFFIDEGFGSLDEKSLKTVFETLKSLKEENRIVGIISHVGNLKEEIDAALYIHRHEEKGSKVSYAWEM